MKLIVLVDEDSGRCKTIECVLTDAGYNVIILEDTRKAERLVDAKAQFDLAIAAVLTHDRGATGIGLAEYISQHRPGTQTLLISHYSRELLRHIPGFNDQRNFLRWPCDASELLSWVRCLTGSRTATHGA